MNNWQNKMLDDGTVIESSLPTSEKQAERTRYNNLRLYKAQIERIIYSDDPSNKTGGVEYDLALISENPRESYRKIRNAVPLNALGGINDYSEIVYKDKTKVFTDGAKGSKAFTSNTNGDIVAVMFLEGNEERAVIVGPWRHKRQRNSAKKSDGRRIKGEYNGVQWNINSDGEFILTVLGGPRDDNGNLTNQSNGNLVIKLGKDGIIRMDINGDAFLTIDKSNNTITLDAAHVKIGTNAEQALVRGDAFRTLFNAHTHATPAGPSDVPFQQMDPSSSNTQLSDKHTVE